MDYVITKVDYTGDGKITVEYLKPGLEIETDKRSFSKEDLESGKVALEIIDLSQERMIEGEKTTILKLKLERVVLIREYWGINY